MCVGCGCTCSKLSVAVKTSYQWSSWHCYQHTQWWLGPARYQLFVMCYNCGHCDGCCCWLLGGGWPIYRLPRVEAVSACVYMSAQGRVVRICNARICECVMSSLVQFLLVLWPHCASRPQHWPLNRPIQHTSAAALPARQLGNETCELC